MLFSKSLIITFILILIFNFDDLLSILILKRQPVMRNVLHFPNICCSRIASMMTGLLIHVGNLNDQPLSVNSQFTIKISKISVLLLTAVINNLQVHLCRNHSYNRINHLYVVPPFFKVHQLPLEKNHVIVHFAHYFSSTLAEVVGFHYFLVLLCFTGRAFKEFFQFEEIVVR